MSDEEQIYCDQLFAALLKVTDYKLNLQLARQIAERYTKATNLSDPDLMHLSVVTIASNLLVHLKPDQHRQRNVGK